MSKKERAKESEIGSRGESTGWRLRTGAGGGWPWSWHSRLDAPVISGHPSPLPCALSSRLAAPQHGLSWNSGWGCLVPGLNQTAKSHHWKAANPPRHHSNPRLNLLPGAAFFIYPEESAGSLRGPPRCPTPSRPHGPREAIVLVSLSQFSHYWE